MKCSEYTPLVKSKEKKSTAESDTSKPNKRSIKNKFTSLNLGVVQFIRGANGYGFGGIYVG